MKWIGQHIWSFISRFRSDVYLENVAESAQDHVVGIDANGKLYKQDVSVGDITGVTITTDSGGGSAASDTSGSADFSILGSSGVGVTNSGTTITAVSVPGEIDHDSLLNFVSAEHYDWASDIVATIHTNNITDLHGAGVDGSANQLLTDDGDGTITSESGLTWDGDDLTITSASTARPDVYIKATANHAKPPHLYFLKDKGAAGVNGDQPGLIAFQGDNANQTLRTFAQIITFATEVTAGDEAGQISLEVASSSGTTSVSKNAFTAIGSSSAYQVDTSIGFGTSSTATIAGNLDVDGELISSRTNLIITPGGTLEIDSTGDMTLDSSANIELNADGGEIVFKDDTATLAKISADGLSFVDNTGAGIIFEGTTDDAYNTTLTAADTTSSSKTITLPDATGTVQLQGENTGQVVHINIQDLNSYIFYMYNDDSWYSAGGQTLAILGTSTAPSDISSANSEYQSRVGCYTAIANCTVKKLTFTFYWTSSAVNSADVDFAFTKFTPITDGTAATITMNAIAATDHNASYTEVKPYQVTFTFSGGNASLSAGDSFGFHMRTTGGSSAQRVIVYGNAMLSVELN